MEDEWAEGLAAPRQSFAALCAAIADCDDEGTPRGERLEILVADDEIEAQARAALSGLGARFHRIAYGDIWLRDTGPVFLLDPDGQGLAASLFRFDGWGGKYLFEADPLVGSKIVEFTKTPAIRHDLVLEGGAIEVDGEGTVLTTRQCLLGGGRNPGRSEAELEALLCTSLGVNKVLWLDRGLQNDHTDGHIDTLARFVAPGVVACMAPAKDDPNHDALAGIIDDLGKMTDAKGRKLEILTVPSPGAVLDASGELMPASYMNFYIGNTAVVVPTYGAATDDDAVAAIAKAFPGRRTVGVDGKPILVGGGAFHCITQQQPLPGGGQ